MSELDHYARVYDAVYEALDHESQESIDDAIASAIEAYHADNDARGGSDTGSPTTAEKAVGGS